MNLKAFCLAFALLGAAGAATGCEEDAPLEDAAEDVGDAAEDVVDRAN